MATVIKNGTIITSDNEFRGDILISDGKIVGIGDIEPKKEDQIIDAEGKYVFPGGVDQHTHAYGHEVVQRSGPDTDGGTLAGIVGHDSRQGLGGHVSNGIAYDVNNVGQNEHWQAEALAGAQVENGHDHQHVPSEP